MRVSSEISNLIPYVPGKPIAETKREKGLDQVIKLASNESLLGPSPLVLESIKSVQTELHRYPDAGSFELTQEFCRVFQVKPEEVAFGNGSNELIDLLIRVFCEKGDAILTSEKAFIAYQICAQAARVQTITTPLTPDFRFDLKAMAEQLRTQQNIKIVFLANPNNPTGTYFTCNEWNDFIAEFGRREDLLIVLDEAYAEFVRATDIPRGLSELKNHKNLVVLRTFSKVYGLANLRLGALLAHPSITQWIHRIRNPFNVSGVAQVAGIAALRDQDFVKKVCELTWQGLDYLTAELKALNFNVLPSQGNFLLFDTKTDANRMYEAWLNCGVIVRPVKNYGLPQHLRISVGTPVENKLAITALQQILKGI